MVSDNKAFIINISSSTRMDHEYSTCYEQDERKKYIKSTLIISMRAYNLVK